MVNGGPSTLRQLSADVSDLADRLGRLEQAVAKLTDGARAGAAVADVLEQLDDRLATVEAALDARCVNDTNDSQPALGGMASLPALTQAAIG